MNFIEEIERREYRITRKDANQIVIEKQSDVCDSVIVFHLKEKVLDYFIKPNCIIKDLAPVSFMYGAYKKLMEDIDELGELSQYKINYRF